jgi:hypothetical protein
MACDICSKEMSSNEGYILTTTQVVLSPGYWRRMFRLLEAGAAGNTRDQAEAALPQFVQRVAGSTTDWMVCEECMNFLDIDHKTPRKYFVEYASTGRAPSIPGSGKTDLTRVTQVAVNVFETMYGRKPNVTSASVAQAIVQEEASRRQPSHQFQESLCAPDSEPLILFHFLSLYQEITIELYKFMVRHGNSSIRLVETLQRLIRQGSGYVRRGYARPEMTALGSVQPYLARAFPDELSGTQGDVVEDILNLEDYEQHVEEMLVLLGECCVDRLLCVINQYVRYGKTCGLGTKQVLQAVGALGRIGCRERRVITALEELRTRTKGLRILSGAGLNKLHAATLLAIERLKS